MSAMQLWIFRALWVIAALWIGAWQEHIKIDINYVIEQGALIPGFDQLDVPTKIERLRATHAYMPYDYFYSHTPIEWIVQFQLPALGQLKWAITGLSILIFFLLNRMLIATFDSERIYKRALGWGYAFVLTLGVLIYAGARMAGAADTGYRVAREMAGGLQSLVPVMMVYPFYLLQQSTNNKKK